MKKYLLSLFFLSIANLIMAEPIGKTEAMSIAKEFLKTDNSLVLVQNHHQLSSNAESSNPDVTNLLYVFNIGEEQGFVIVSGDDLASPILGYCDHGSFSYDKIPENLSWWLNYYEESIQMLQNDTEGVIAAKISSRPTDVVKPLIKTHWNQDYPYNILCPEQSGQKCPTGCVATALAQVMYYHKHPIDSCKPIPSYFIEGLNINMPELPATEFKWDKMKNSYGYYDSEESRNAVAELMLYCGQSVQMSYSISGSGTHTSIVEQSLPEYFHYPKTIHCVWRDPFSIEQWDDILLNELNNNRPILYSGYTTANEGHAFICDGYDGNGYYHINWGWGGAADGYYLISVLNATANGIGGSSTSLRFTTGQFIMVGIQTDGDDNFEAPTPYITAVSRPCLVNGKHFVREDNTKNFEPFKIGINLLYYSTNGSWGEYLSYGFGLFDDNGDLLRNLQTSSEYFWNGYSRGFVSNNIRIGKDEADGHYTIKPICRYNNEWVPVRNADMQYVDVIIDGQNLTLTPVPKADFEVSNIRKSGKSVVFDLYNPSEEYKGYMFLRKMEGGDIKDIAYETVVIEPESNREIAIYLTNGSLDLDNDVYFLSVDDFSSDYFYANVTNDNSVISKSMEIINLNSDDNTVYGKAAMCRVNVSNSGSGVYHHFIITELSDEEGNTVGDKVQNLVDIQPDDNYTFDVELPINDFTKEYRVKLTHIEGLGNNIAQTSESFNVARGAVYWTGDGTVHTLPAESTFNVPEDAVSINLRNAYTKNVKANENPNTLYILDKSVPKGLSGKNVFNYENASGNVVLEDGYDYYIPSTLSAKTSLTYQRTFGADEILKWTTICLPFTPTKILAGDKTLDWFRYNGDVDKDLWIMEFQGVEGDKAIFSYAEEIKENTPYLIAVMPYLEDETIVFSTGKTSISPTYYSDRVVTKGDYDFVGFNAACSMMNMFLFNGKQFDYARGSTNHKPFRAALRSKASSHATVLYLDAADLTDGIMGPRVDNPSPASYLNDAVYNIEGQNVGKISNFSSLPKGIYIFNGKKLVKK